jgi:hypothetical protein
MGLGWVLFFLAVAIFKDTNFAQDIGGNVVEFAHFSTAPSGQKEISQVGIGQVKSGWVRLGQV